jgi:hypothetical protein
MIIKELVALTGIEPVFFVTLGVCLSYRENTLEVLMNLTVLSRFVKNLYVSQKVKRGV